MRLFFLNRGHTELTFTHLAAGIPTCSKCTSVGVRLRSTLRNRPHEFVAVALQVCYLQESFSLTHWVDPYIYKHLTVSFPVDIVADLHKADHQSQIDIQVGFCADHFSV